MLITLHLWTLCLTGLVILYGDHQGLAYFRGKKKVLEYKKMLLVHRLVFIGLFGMIVSGALLAYPMAEYLIAEPTFLLKLFFVFTLLMNGLFIHKTVRIACERPFTELSQKEKTTMLISGAISVFCWVGAASIGFLFF